MRCDLVGVSVVRVALQQVGRRLDVTEVKYSHLEVETKDKAWNVNSQHFYNYPICL